jgi:hypothetical protein
MQLSQMQAGSHQVTANSLDHLKAVTGLGLGWPQVPCASTLCIVNLGASEARVELLASQFVALRREAGAGGLGDGEAGNDHFLFDDDDNYQFPVRAQHHSSRAQPRMHAPVLCMLCSVHELCHKSAGSCKLLALRTVLKAELGQGMQRAVVGG